MLYRPLKKMPVGITLPCPLPFCCTNLIPHSTTCPLPIYCSNLFPILFTFYPHYIYSIFLIYFIFTFIFIFILSFPHLHYIHFIFMLFYILCMSNHFQVPMEMQSHWTSTTALVLTSVKAHHPIFILSYLKMRMHFHSHIPIGIGIR